MKKIFIAGSCLLLGLLISNVDANSASDLPDNPATFSLASMPNGLANGTFSIGMTFVGGNYSSSGPVNNQDNRYGLVGSLRDLNEEIHDGTYNGQPIYYFGLNLSVTLTCKNHTSVTYRYDATDVRTKGAISLQPPANCN